MPTPTVQVRIERNDAETVVVCLGEIDVTSCDPLTVHLEEISSIDARSVTLDLSGVTFIDSTGVRCLLRFASRCEERGVTLRTMMSPAVQRVVDILGIAGALGAIQDLPPRRRVSISPFRRARAR